MALFRKLVTLAITTGLAKKAWDSYRRNQGVAATGTSRARDLGERSATTVQPKRSTQRPDAD